MPDTPPRDARVSNLLLNIIVYPGLGTIREGRLAVGLSQVLLATVGLLVFALGSFGLFDWISSNGFGDDPSGVLQKIKEDPDIAARIAEAHSANPAVALGGVSVMSLVFFGMFAICASWTWCLFQFLLRRK